MHLCAAHWPYKISGSSSATGLEHEVSPEPNAIPVDYRDALKLADSQLGRIMAGLKRRNLYDQALIVVLSDHGESFGAGDSWGHGTSLFDDAQNHVLIAIKPPFAATGQERNELVSTVDIAPTILDVLAISREPYSYDGQPLLAEKSPLLSGNREIFMETGFHLFHKSGKGLPCKRWSATGTNSTRPLRKADVLRCVLPIMNKS
jgi:arylsulfatase A-like enzyme